jgi:acetolactate synthase-1/2/3 large subunit
VPGESFLPLLDALGASKIDTITARHESSAGFMAMADGRLSGRPGVFMVSRGPGATNASIAVHSAQQDGTPLILMIGQGERQHVGRDSFQEIDYSKMFGSIAKWVYEINDPTRVPEVMARAFSVAMSGTPGPVVISLPEDILPIELPDVKARASVVASSAPTPQAMARVLELLAQAERPLLLAGGDFATDEQRAALRAAAEKHNIPVCNEVQVIDGVITEWLNEVTRLPQGSKLIIEDAASTDGTVEILEKYLENPTEYYLNEYKTFYYNI